MTRQADLAAKLSVTAALLLGVFASGCVITSRPARDRCDGRATTSCDTICNSDDRSDCFTECSTVCEPVEVVVHEEPPAPVFGDLALGWAFEGAMGCYDAGVEVVTVDVIGIDTADGTSLSLPCEDYGVTLYDFVAGQYRVQVEGIGLHGELRYASSSSATVYGYAMTDLGLVVLSDLAPPPLVGTGSLALDWAFRYPDVDSTYDCVYAGVDYLDLVLTDAYGQVAFSASVACTDGPVAIDELTEGLYTVDLIAVGGLDGLAIDLYAAPRTDVRVLAGREVDLGVLELDRLGDSFGDFDLAWSFGGMSCANEGVDQVTLRIVRTDLDLVDDEFTVYCDQQPLMRPTFVPGDYLVELEAVDSLGYCWFGLADVGLAPGGTVVLDLDASLVNCQ